MHGISIMAIKLDDGRYRYGYGGSFDGMNWIMTKCDASPERSIQRLNNRAKTQLEKIENNFTTLEKLKTAPVDSVVVITGKSSYELLDGSERISSSKDFDFEKHLKT